MFKKLPLKGYFYASFAINLLVIISIFIVKRWLPPVVPLLYGMPAGADELVPTLGLIIAPLSSIFITSINLALAVKFEGVFAKKMLAIVSFLLSLLTIITIGKIVFLVGF